MERQKYNSLIQNSKRIVIKIGSARVSGDKREINDFLFSLADDIRHLRDMGKQTIVVSSGAIAQGVNIIEKNNIQIKSKSKRTLPEKQALAALGQSQLMYLYESFFSKVNINIAQILFGLSDIQEDIGIKNLKNTFNQLLNWRILPIVNENDSIATEELKLGDNDILSALVSVLIDADLLIIITGVDGFLMDNKTVPLLKKITEQELDQATGPAGPGTGGMNTKLKAARILQKSGRTTVIINGKIKNSIRSFVDENKSGTLIVSEISKKLLNEIEIRELFQNQLDLYGH